MDNFSGKGEYREKAQLGNPYSMHSISSSPSPAARLLAEIVGKPGLSRPDGRPLYRYRISDEHYTRGRRLLLQWGALGLDSQNRNLCAVLVMVVAEWYRREAATLSRRWRDASVLPLDLTVADRGAVVDAGLRWWGIELRKTGSRFQERREFLMTVALSGGLPSMLLVGGEANRVRSYFERIMEDALEKDPFGDRPDIASLVLKHVDELPLGYQDDAIFELSVELIERLAELRELIPTEVRLADPAGWLDVHRPEWRGELPLYLPDNAEAANLLFQELLKKRSKPVERGIGVERLLLRGADGRWSEGIRLHANGSVSRSSLAPYGEGRFRIFLTGEAARAASSEVAHLHQTGDDIGGGFSQDVSPTRSPVPIAPVPFAAPVQVTLRRDGLQVDRFTWPRGEGRPGICHVLRYSSRESELLLVATGSCRSREEELFVWAEATAMLSEVGAGDVERLVVQGSWALWRVSGMVNVSMDDGTRFRVHTRADSEEAGQIEIALAWTDSLSFETSGLIPTSAPLHVTTKGGRTTGRDLSFWRGGRQVKEHQAKEGLLTVRWRDAEGFEIDRARVIAMPPYTIEGRITIDGAIVTSSGLPGWRLEALDVEGQVLASSSGKGGMHVPWGGVRQASQRLRIIDPSGCSVLASLELVPDRIHVADAQGRILADGAVLAPHELRNAHIIVDNRQDLHFTLRGADIANVNAVRHVSETTPMIVFAELIDGLLGLSSERGPRVEIETTNGRILCRVQRPQIQPSFSGRTVDFCSAVFRDDDFVVARPFIEIDREYALFSAGPNTYNLPEALEGPCLVYVRRGDAVVTRPKVIQLPLSMARKGGLSPFPRANLIDDETERSAALDSMMDKAAETTGDASDAAVLTRLIRSLNGLSPRAIDLTRRLPRHPRLLCRVLLSANDEARSAVLSLERHLPFLWMALPIAAWREAAATVVDQMAGVLREAKLPTPESSAAETIMRTFEELRRVAPWFTGTYLALGLSGKLEGSLRTLAQDHVRRHADTHGAIGSDFAVIAKKMGMPPAIQELNYEINTVLVAPVVLAAAATGRLTLDGRASAAMRDALDFDPDYIVAAYPHCLHFLIK